VRHFAPLLVVAALGCGSNPGLIPSGDFSGPDGLAIAPLPDRDLLFVANQGANELRAITMCQTNPQQLPSCPTSQDLQFLPAPVRLFAGSILVGERPVRLAGVPLQGTDNTTSPPSTVPHGAVLVAGLGVLNAAGTIDPVLQVIDAQNILSASQDKTVTAAPPKAVPMPASPIDVVAVDNAGASVGAVAVTQGPGTGGTLVILNVALGSDGLAAATPVKSCALDFTPTRLALVPSCQPQTTPYAGTCVDDRDPATNMPLHVYVADGTPGGTPGGVGDGLVEVTVASIPDVGTGAPPACPNVRRIPASDPQDSPRRARPLKTIALSPPSLGFTDPNNPTALVPVLPGGHVILGVTLEDPALCADHGSRVCPAELNVPAGALCVDQGMQNCGTGRIVMLSNDPAAGQSAVMDAPVPVTPQGSPPPPRLPMQPIRPVATAAREVSFMGRTQCPNPATAQTPLPPCTAVRVGVGDTNNATIIQRSVIGVASMEDGSTVFIDIDNKRFFDDLRDTSTSPPTPALTSCPISPSCPPPGVTLAPAAVDASGNPIFGDKQNGGWMNPGITRVSHWFIEWHSNIRGLDSISGTLSRSAPGASIRLTLGAGTDLTPWITSPEFQLGAASTCSVPYPDCVGDFVRVKSYSPTATCGDLAVVPITTDIPILAVHPDGLDLQPVPGFDPDPSCFASGNVGGTFEVHAGETTAGGWSVREDLDVLGRVPNNVQIVVTGPRLDYPVSQYPYPVTPPATDIALSFTITGPEPTIAGTTYDMVFSPGVAATAVRDPTALGAPGFAGPILVYGSLRRANDEVVITSITGSNSVFMGIPAQFGVAGSVRFFY
jgi:hypothetical protein